MSGTSRATAVEAERIEGWFERFVASHGSVSWRADASALTVTAADGSVAVCTIPFPPMNVDLEKPYGGLVAHVLQPRRVGVLLVRRGGFAAGVFDGAALLESKVGSRHVQGRSAAGGWSQQRFARRRDGQARVAYEAAADAAVLVLLPAVGRLEALVLGGDRPALTAVLEDNRLAPLRGLVVDARIDVPDPRRSVLEATPKQFRAVRITITDS